MMPATSSRLSESDPYLFGRRNSISFRVIARLPASDVRPCALVAVPSTVSARVASPLQDLIERLVPPAAQ